MVIAILFYFLLSFENSLSRAVASMHESRSAGAAVASMYRNTCGWVSTAGAAPGASSSVIVITVASEEDSLRLGGVHKLRYSVESWKILQFTIQNYIILQIEVGLVLPQSHTKQLLLSKLFGMGGRRLMSDE